MSSVPVARYLMDLTAGASGAGVRPVAAFRRKSEAVSEAEQKLEEARTLGVLEGRAAAEAEYKKEMEQRVADLEERFSQERAEWARAQGTLLSEQVRSQFEDIEVRFAEQVSSVLRPFVSAEVQQAAVEEMTMLLRGALADGEASSVKISAPKDLLGVIEEGVGERAGLSFIESDDCEVSVVMDGTVIETRIGEWMRVLEGDPS